MYEMHKYLKKLILIHKYLNKLNFIWENLLFENSIIRKVLSISSDKGGSTLITREFS